MAGVLDRIERDAAVLGGKPVLRGIPIAVEHVLSLLTEDARRRLREATLAMADVETEASK